MTAQPNYFEGPKVTHDDIVAYANAKVNLPKVIVDARRTQIAHLKSRLEHYIGEHPDYDLLKIRGSGSVTKGTALKSSSDADMAAYVEAAAVGGITVPEAELLSWLRERLIEVYGNTKTPEDFVISHHAVGITYSSGFKVDVAPVIYEGAADDRGFLVTRQGERVLTSVKLHLDFIRRRKAVHGTNYAQLIRLLKAWVKEQKRVQGDAFRCKSFLVELVVAHLADEGWEGRRVDMEDLPTALEQIFAFTAVTRLGQRISFTDYYSASDLPRPNGTAMEVFDPVNPDNNVVKDYSIAHRETLANASAAALDAISEAAYADTKGHAVSCWKRVFGPGFGV
jgi:tRNA nucleotidyltransferase (CCA-adding enzyme)